MDSPFFGTDERRHRDRGQHVGARERARARAPDRRLAFAAYGEHEEASVELALFLGEHPRRVLDGERGRARVQMELPTVEEIDLDRLLSPRPVHVVLELIGLGVRSDLEGEVGCHLWSSLLSGSSIVRVKLHEGSSPRELIASHLDRARAFERALDRTEDLPDDPAHLMPAVRRIRFDPPERPGESALLELEDYATGQVRIQNVRRVAEALEPLVWLRTSRLM